MSPWLALAAIPGIGLLVQRLLCERERRLHPPPGVLVDAGGFRMHFHARGSGAPVVVLDSALAGTSLSWSEVQEKVAAFTRVVSYDRAGFGWSDPSPEPRRVDCLVAELRGGLKALEVEPPFVLVGHSYGGFVAKLFARRHPGEVAGLVLVDVPHARKWVHPDSAERERIARGTRIARAAGILGHFGLTRLVFRFAGPRRIEEIADLLAKLPSRHRSAVRSFWVRSHTLRALASLIEEAPRSAVLVENAWGDLGDLPLAVVTAAAPSPEKLRDQEEEAGRSRRSRHIISERSGHFVPLEEPEVVVEAIRSVVTSARSSTFGAPNAGAPGEEEAPGARTIRSGP